MVFIRNKKVKGENYLYLVKSVWDSKKNSSRQETIKYLGNASKINSTDIPEEYRNNPKILSFLSSFKGIDIKKKEKILEKMRDEFYFNSIKGDSDKVFEIFENFVKSSTTERFFDEVLRPSMERIGDQWEKGKISIASEHVASNIAVNLVKGISSGSQENKPKGKILICTPNGEEHNLGCNVLESFLKRKKYQVYNLSPSQPTESILQFIRENSPDLVLVSITLEENLMAGQRLIKKISENFPVPILTGGIALSEESKTIEKIKMDATILSELSLNSMYNVMRRKLNSKNS